MIAPVPSSFPLRTILVLMMFHFLKLNFIFLDFRLREPVHLVNATTRPTPCVCGAARWHSTSRRKSALPVDTLVPGSASTTGPSKPRGGRPLEPAACSTLRSSEGSSATDSVDSTKLEELNINRSIMPSASWQLCWCMLKRRCTNKIFRFVIGPD